MRDSFHRKFGGSLAHGSRASGVEWSASNARHLLNFWQTAAVRGGGGGNKEAGAGLVALAMETNKPKGIVAVPCPLTGPRVLCPSLRCCFLYYIYLCVISMCLPFRLCRPRGVRCVVVCAARGRDKFASKLIRLQIVPGNPDSWALLARVVWWAEVETIHSAARHPQLTCNKLAWLCSGCTADSIGVSSIPN